MNSSLALTGIHLNAPHFTDFLMKKPKVAWVEVQSESYFADGGKPLHLLEKVRKDYPVSLNGVALSLGSADELNWQHLQKLRNLARQIHPCLISDHLAWSSINGQYLHDTLPLPYTEESLTHIITRVEQIQDYLKQPLLIENIASYITYAHTTISESAFLSAIANATGCGILLDLTNLYLNAANLNIDALNYIKTLPAKNIQAIHLSGFSTMMLDSKEILIDSHNMPIVPAIWDLYRQTIQMVGMKPTMIEWTEHLPCLETLCLEAYRAETILRESHATTHITV